LNKVSTKNINTIFCNVNDALNNFIGCKNYSFSLNSQYIQIGAFL